jgi:hypothetical protein
MSQRTRYFLIASVLVMSVGLGGGLVAYYHGGLPLMSPSAGPAELAYLPVETTAVAYANVNEIMNSGFRQRIRQVLPTGEAKDQLLAELGLDIEHDIDSVVAGVTGATPTLNGALVLVRGRINAVQLEALAVQHGATTEDYKGKHLILASEVHSLPSVGGAAPAAQPFTGAMAVLEPGLVAFGDLGAIKRGIDASLSHDDATKNDDLMKFVIDAEKNSNAWAVGRFDGMTNSTVLPKEIEDFKDRLAVKWMSVSAHVDAGVSGTLRAEARDQEAADQIRSIANGALAAGQLMAGHDSKLDGMLKSLQVTGTGTTVAMSFSVPPEMLDMLNGIAGLSNLMGKDKAPSAPREIRK